MAAPDFKTWVIWTLRKASYRWPARSKAFRAAAASYSQFIKYPGVGILSLSKRVRNFYWCKLCDLVFPRKLVSADHIKPVIDPARGFVDWNEYIKRLFCSESGFQIICKECHDAKTRHERKVRTVTRRLKRK
jgi:hypothetical protein